MKTAAYARFSSDSQREASLEDQLRNCRAFCARQGWAAPEVYQDAAVSGARLDRPGYQQLLRDADLFDVILVDDLSRFGRDKEELGMVIKRLRFRGVRLIGVSDGVDTARKNHKLDTGLRGLMSELYLDDLAEKTHRGLTGRALAGASAGGLPYGYRALGDGQREIDEAQAAVVRRIYAEYIDGRSPREIAAALNSERVRSPRGGQWAMSVIYGDVRRGIGILANPIYIGRQVWNRSHWVKHPETGRRVRKERPESEWITTEKLELAIIDRSTWEAAQARIRGASPARTVTPGAGAGRPPKHLLSGLLRCDHCGGPMVIVDRYRYGCARHKDRGDSVCPSRLRVPRATLEHALLASIRKDLLSEAAFARFQRAAAEALKRAAPDLDSGRRRVAEAERVHENVMGAIRAGIITASTKAELVKSEADVVAARAHLDQLKAFQPAQFLPRARERWQSIIDRLADVGRNKHEARAAIRDLLGDRITLKSENGDLIAEVAASSEISVVAGAGFEPATFGL
ncbi:recombinase family protein [Dyella lutea]|uniref:recombinase family protein n=1 Tax=Dyella lutea TaxID=2950441 RepID=UPI003CCC99C9